MSADAATHMPVAFLGHGTPLNALMANRWTSYWSRERGLWQPARYIGHIRALVHGWNRRHRDGGAPDHPRLRRLSAPAI